MQQYIETALIGGLEGDNFNDIYIRKDDGSFIVNDNKKDTLDVKHPLKEIVVHGVAPVKGLSVTYQLTSGDTVTFHHGTKGHPRMPTYPLQFEANEVLAGIYGHATDDGFYKIGFVINDQEKGTVRTFGPFGTETGTPFYVSDILAFGGFSQDEPKYAEGRLYGMYFFKNVGTN